MLTLHKAFISSSRYWSTNEFQVFISLSASSMNCIACSVGSLNCDLWVLMHVHILTSPTCEMRWIESCLAISTYSFSTSARQLVLKLQMWETRIISAHYVMKQWGCVLENMLRLYNYRRHRLEDCYLAQKKHWNLSESYRTVGCDRCIHMIYTELAARL